MYMLEIVDVMQDFDWHYETEHPRFFSTKEKAIAAAEARFHYECKYREIKRTIKWEEKESDYLVVPTDETTKQHFEFSHMCLNFSGGDCLDFYVYEVVMEK